MIMKLQSIPNWKWNKFPRYGNSGKDLYYYHLLFNGDSIYVKRNEYLYDQCEKIDDPEDYKVDVSVLSDKRIYVICETGIGRFRGFEINQMDKSLTKKSKIAFHLMNYPYFRNDVNTTFTIPKYYKCDRLNFIGKVFMNNPYPASRADEEIDIRFKSYSNITIFNLDDKKDIAFDKDYKPELSLKIIPKRNLEK